MPEKAVTWTLTVLCETKHLLPSTSLQKDNTSTWLHNILLAQLTNKITGQLGCQDLTPFCYVSPLMLNPSWTPHLCNKLWGQLRKAPGSCCGVCCSSGTLLVCLLWEGTEAQRALTGTAVCWWGGTPAMLNACPCSCNTDLGYVV